MCGIAAMAGAILAARLQHVPVVLDGYVVTAAAAVLHALSPDSISHCLAGHCSAEGAHREVLDRLGLVPLLDLGMRLGEGTGAAFAMALLKGALACFKCRFVLRAQPKVSRVFLLFLCHV